MGRAYFFSDFRFCRRESVERAAMSARRCAANWSARFDPIDFGSDFFSFFLGRCGIRASSQPRSPKASGDSTRQIHHRQELEEAAQEELFGTPIEQAHMGCLSGEDENQMRISLKK